MSSPKSIGHRPKLQKSLGFTIQGCRKPAPLGRTAGRISLEPPRWLGSLFQKQCRLQEVEKINYPIVQRNNGNDDINSNTVSIFS